MQLPQALIRPSTASVHPIILYVFGNHLLLPDSPYYVHLQPSRPVTVGSRIAINVTQHWGLSLIEAELGQVIDIKRGHVCFTIINCKYYYFQFIVLPLVWVKLPLLSRLWFWKELRQPPPEDYPLNTLNPPPSAMKGAWF